MKHILAVDDEALIRRLLELNLQRAGYRVTTAVDGEDALRKVQADRPDLVVLDIVMPRMDGFEVLRRLKEDPETDSIPVIILSAKFHDADVFHGMKEGSEHFLNKPFSPVELLSTVANALRPVEPAAE